MRQFAISWVAVCMLVVLPGSRAHAQGGAEGWSAPIRLSQAVTSWWPTVAADPMGGVHVLWQFTELERAEADAPGPLFYLRMDGERRSEPIDVLLSPGGGQSPYPDVACDSNGYLHVVWGGSSLFYSRAPTGSADSAKGWAVPVRLSDEQVGQADIVADDRGGLHIAYPGSVTSIHYLVSYDGGHTWGSPVSVSGVSEENVGFSHARLAIGAGGTIHVIWTQVPLPGGYPPLGVFYARSLDRGRTWSPPMQVAGIDYAEGNVITMGDRIVHLVWHGRVGVGGTFHQWSSDGGRTWSVPQELFPGGGLTRDPALAVDSAGTLHLAGVGADGLTYSFWRDGDWARPVIVDPGDQVPHHPALAISSGNRLNLVWMRHETDHVVYSARRTSAPYVPSPTSPTSTPALPVVPVCTLEPVPASETAPPIDRALFQAGARGRKASAPIVAGVVPVGLLVAAVAIVKLVRVGRS